MPPRKRRKQGSDLPISQLFAASIAATVPTANPLDRGRALGRFKKISAAITRDEHIGIAARALRKHRPRWSAHRIAIELLKIWPECQSDIPELAGVNLPAERTLRRVIAKHLS